MTEEQIAEIGRLLDVLDGAILTDKLQAKVFANTRALLAEVDRLRVELDVTARLYLQTLESRS